MDVFITKEHLEAGVKGSPAQNPLTLAIKAAIKSEEKCMHVLVSAGAFLQVLNLDLTETEFSRQLGEDAQWFIENWNADQPQVFELPYKVNIIPTRF